MAKALYIQSLKKVYSNEVSATVVIADGRLDVQDGLVGKANIRFNYF
jgi:hypothetical protein